MTSKLFFALYVGLIIGMFILFIANFALGWIYFAFVFVSLWGGLYFMERPYWIAAGFLLTSLIVLILGVMTGQPGTGYWITIVVSGSMSALSAFTLFHVRNYKPAPPVIAPTPRPVARRKPHSNTPPPAAAASHNPPAPYTSGMEAIKCPSCGSPDLEGDYPEYKCSYCGTRFVDTQGLNRISPSVG